MLFFVAIPYIQKEIEPWLHRRIRQLILKRWKRPKTVIHMLTKYGLEINEAKRVAYSRKKYWRLSMTKEIHKALTVEKLHRWGLVSLTLLVEQAYARY